MLTSGKQLGPGLEKTPDIKINNSLFLDDRDNKQAHAPHPFLTLQESRNCRLKNVQSPWRRADPWGKIALGFKWGITF